MEELLREGLKKLSGIEVAFIYGSYAAEEERGSSDIDVLVVGTPPKLELARKLREIGEKVDRDINYVSYSKTSFQNLKKKHSSFIESVIKKPKIFLIGNKNDIG